MHPEPTPVPPSAAAEADLAPTADPLAPPIPEPPRGRQGNRNAFPEPSPELRPSLESDPEPRANANATRPSSRDPNQNQNLRVDGPHAVRRRADAAAAAEVGKARQSLYRDGFRWINHCLTQGFFIEAICLVESLIADRLEARLTFVLGKDFSFKALERLIRQIASDEPDETLRGLVLDELRVWKDDRNHAAHEMLKLAEGEQPCWEDRYRRNDAVARAGLALLRKIDGRISTLKKIAKALQSASPAETAEPTEGAA